jgi:hypothetical protein
MRIANRGLQMNHRLFSQSGITFVGLCFLFLFLGSITLFVLRAFPLYNMKFEVVSAMNSVTSRPDATTMTDEEVKKFFLHNIQVTNIQLFNHRNINQYLEIIKPRDSRHPKLMHVHFEKTNILFGDIYLLMKFDEKKALRGPLRSEY